MHRLLFAGALCAPLVLLARPADARSFRVSQLPSAPNSCNTCHSRGGGSPLNSFGRDVERTLVRGDVNWSAICALDSDGDRASNGAELGDPGCRWRIGDPATRAASDPADPQSTPPPQMDAGVPDTGPGIDAGPAMDAGPAPDMGPAMDAGPAPDMGPAMDAAAAPDMGPAPDLGPPETGPRPDASGVIDVGTGPADSGAAPTDAGTGGGTDAGDDDDDDDDGGCTCAAPQSASRSWLLGLPLLGLLFIRRRR